MELSQPKPSNQEPRISVIIPTYNKASYIRQSIDSVLSQTYTSYEVIVIDDGSIDNTRSILQSYNDRIRYVFQGNQGVCAARNHGIRIARGEFVVFLDADDYFLHGKLTEQIAAFEAITSLGIVHSGWRLVDEEGKTIKHVEPWNDVPNLDLEGWLLWKPVFPGAMMFRKEYLERAGGFDTSLRQAEDVDLVLRLALIGCKAVWLRKSTVCYRLHGENTIKDGLQQAEDLQTVLDNFYNLPDVPYRIRKKERAIRYHTLIWIVWQLYQTDSSDYISEYLRETLKLSVYFPTMKFAVLDLAEKLAQNYLRNGKKISEMRIFWPFFKEAVQLDEAHWIQIENTLNWLLDVWQHYLHHDRLLSVIGLSSYKELTTREIVKRASPVIFVCSNTTVNMVSHFWQDAMDKGLVSLTERHEITSLYLSVFAEAFFGLHWRKVLIGLCYAVRYGIHPRAWRIWFRFFKTTLSNIKKPLSGIISRALSISWRQ